MNHWQRKFGVEVIAPPAANTTGARSRTKMRWLRQHRKIIETVIARLTETIGLKRINAHSEHGMIARIAANMAAYNIGVLFNRNYGRADGALATLIC